MSLEVCRNSERVTRAGRNEDRERASGEGAGTYGARVADALALSRSATRRSYQRACLAGYVPAFGLYLVLVAGGRASLTYSEPASSFYGAQARAWLEGRWNVPPGVLGPEAITRGTDAYGYFGPFPALLRLPVMAIDAEMQGRLGGLSLIGASIVFALACSRLLWLVGPWRGIGGQPLRTRDAAIVGLWSATALVGSTWLFLGSRTFMYHESIAWAVALSVAGITVLLTLLESWNRPTVGLLFVVLAAAVHSRAATSSGLLLAIGVAAATLFLRKKWSRSALLVGLAVAVVASFSAVNVAKFGHPIAVPWEQHAGISADPKRLARLDRFGLFGLRYIPTTLVQYTRPDGLGYLDVAPWLTFPNRPPAIVGNAPLDGVEHASSITASMPAITALAVIGTAVAVRRRREISDVSLVVLPLFAGWLPTLASAGVTHRYVADLLPPLLATSAVGAAWVANRPGRRIRSLVLMIGVLAGWSIIANSSLALLYQRAYSNGIDRDVRAHFVSVQRDLRTVLGGRFPVITVPLGAPLPPMRAGQFAIVGDCDGLYLFNGQRLEPVERSAPTGELRVDLRLVPQPPGTLEPLLSIGRYEAADLLIVKHVAPGRAVLAFDHWGSPLVEGVDFSFEAGEPMVIDVVFDPLVGEVRARSGQKELLSLTPVFYSHPGAPLLLGSNEVSPTVAARFAGAISLVDTEAERRCSALLPEDRASDHAAPR